MKSIPRRLLTAIAVLALVPFAAPSARTEQAPASGSKRAIQLEDIIAWKSIGVTVLSNDGQWFAYRVAPGEGDAELFVRSVATGKETKFPLGDAEGGGA